MGTLTAAVGFLITYGDLTIYMGTSPSTGMPLGYDGREIFIAICAALGGPLALVIALLQFPFIGLYLSLPASGVAWIMLDRLAAGLAVVFIYRFMHLHARRPPFTLLLWALAIWVYYFLTLNVSFLTGLIVSGRSILEAYRHYGFDVLLWVFRNVEVPFTYVFSVLILLAIPPRFRKPFWIRPRETAPGSAPAMLKGNVT
jgi:hypothetical protein